MIGNELPLANMIMMQNELLFDWNILTFHNSVDGIRNFFEEANKTKVIVNKERGYPQSSISSKMMLDAFLNDADVCIPLDADEFLPFHSKSELEEFLRPFVSRYDFIEVPWRNCSAFPSPMASRVDNLKYAHSQSRVSKVIVFRSAFEKDNQLKLSQGNHLVSSSEHLEGIRVSDSFIIHIPFRSQLHYAKKMLQGAASMFEEKEHDLSDQWIDGAKKPFLSQAELNRESLDYGDIVCLEHSELLPQQMYLMDAKVYDESTEVISFNAVMEEYWSQIVKIFSTTSSSSLSSLEVKQLNRRLAKQRLTARVIRKFKSIRK